MKIWVGVTDREWFEFLNRIDPDEVNFWQPSGSRSFRALQPGEPFFFPRSAWIPIPESWAPNIVQGKTYDTSLADGRALWNSIQAVFAERLKVAEPSFADGSQESNRFGTEYLTRGRLGQGAFRLLVTDAYERRCAVTGEKTLPVLEAAHIKPYSMQGPHCVSNGILMRSDLHKLFDQGYVTVTPELRLEVSPRLKTDWQNGREYYAHHGRPLRVQPSDPASQPSREFLAWHNAHRFRT